MKPIHEYIPHAKPEDGQTINNFDIVDRVVVLVFLIIALVSFILILDTRLTDSELAELAPAIDILGYVLLFFMAWPAIRIPLYWAERAILKRVKPHATQFVGRFE